MATDYKIESLRDNAISFKIYLDYLKLALRSAALSNDVVVKLTKKDKLANLSFHIKTVQVWARNFLLSVKCTARENMRKVY